MGEGKKYVICEKELEVYRRDMLDMRYPLPIPCLRL